MSQPILADTCFQSCVANVQFCVAGLHTGTRCGQCGRGRCMRQVVDTLRCAEAVPMQLMQTQQAQQPMQAHPTAPTTSRAACISGMHTCRTYMPHLTPGFMSAVGQPSNGCWGWTHSPVGCVATSLSTPPSVNVPCFVYVCVVGSNKHTQTHTQLGVVHAGGGGGVMHATAPWVSVMHRQCKADRGVWMHTLQVCGEGCSGCREVCFLSASSCWRPPGQQAQHTAPALSNMFVQMHTLEVCGEGCSG
jgi:hypothetical protein